MQGEKRLKRRARAVGRSEGDSHSHEGDHTGEGMDSDLRLGGKMNRGGTLGVAGEGASFELPIIGGRTSTSLALY